MTDAAMAYVSPYRSTWTEERVAILKQLWADGWSGSQIAARLGGVSRNAVIGKVHRLRLPTRASRVRERAPIMDKRCRMSPGQRKSRQGQSSLANRIAAGTFGTSYLPEPPPPPPAPWDGPPINILDDRLKHGMCRCIVSGSGPETMFCGAPVEDASQFRFCDWHKQTLTSKPTRRRWSPEQREKFIRSQLRRAAMEVSA